MLAKLTQAVALLLIAFIGTPVHGQGLADEKDALEGLDGAYIMGGDIDDVLAETGLQKEDVLSLVAARLSNSGFRVLDETEWLMRDDSPVLHIDLSSKISEEGFALYAVRLEILFLVNPVSRRNFTTFAVAWGEGKFGTLGSRGAPVVLQEIELLLDRLVSDHNAANGS